MKDLKILKIGGSIITKKDRDNPSPDLEQMEKVAEEIKEGISNVSGLILVHGAGSYGHPIVKRTGINKGITNKEDRINFAETQRLQNELNSIFTEVLIGKGVPAFPVQPSASAIMEGKLERMDVEVINGLLDEGLVPVLYGVPAYDRERGCSILSGDEIMPYLARELDAGTVLHGTNVDGIYTSDPNENPDAELIEKVESMEEVRDRVGGSKDTDVTGGMLNKVEEIVDMGISGRIFNASRPGNIIKALCGEEVGTYIESVD